MSQPHVLIAGAGPAGLSSALNLARHGVRVSIFERSTSLPEDMRASTFHPPTLDMLDRFGITDDLVAQGLVARFTQQRDRQEGLIAEFDMSLLEGQTKYPFRLQCEQWKLTNLLRDQLVKLPNVTLHFQSVVEGVEQDANGVRVLVQQEGRTETYSGDYLIGADGAWSAVRRSLGIEFEGFTYPERFLVISTDFPYEDHFDNLSYVNYVSDPQEWCVLLRVPTLWRVLFPTNPEESDEQVLTDDAVEARLQGLVVRDQRYNVTHRTLYKIHQRIAKEFRRGRVVLAGDAAHINNPLGGMGMNGGVHDAFNLSDKLIQILVHGASDTLLDLYERQRRAVAIEYVNINTQRNKKNIEEKDPVKRQAMKEQLRATAEDRSRSLEYVRRTSMFDALESAAAIA